ncbi:MAG: BMC domain-containing protein [Deltaproteobacteria bacterium]|nr:BMC domain-containing protein [Deltaproteobacteria bacterium]
MEFKAIGLIETNSVAKGIECADEMIKASDVEILLARPACPGRYLAMISGDVGSVQNSLDIGKEVAGEFLVDSFVIPNVHAAVFPALSCATPIAELKALGIIETYSSASCITAADAAVKAAEVELIEIRCATGLAGKSFVTLTGDVASVNAAVEAGIELLEDEGLIQSSVVIPSPSKELYKSLV